MIFAVVDEGLGREPAFFGVLMSVQGGGGMLGGITAVGLLRRAGAVSSVGIALGLSLWALRLSGTPAAIPAAALDPAQEPVG